MKNSKKENSKMNRSFPMIVGAVLVISGIGAGIFNMMAEGTVQAGMIETEKIPTSYHVPAAVPVPETVEAKAEVNYHVSMSMFHKETPTEIDLSMEEAAALGVRYLEEIMDFDAEGADVYMDYSGGTVTFPRAFWSGDVRFGKQEKTDEDTWSFFIDAVTGELFMIGCTETLDVEVPLGYDSSLEKDCDIYLQKARELAERLDLVGTTVTNVVYGSQGYGSNNPDISIEVEGENGQKAIITFSRYNQRLLGIITNTSREVTEKAMEDIANGSVSSEDVETIYWNAENEDADTVYWHAGDRVK